MRTSRPPGNPDFYQVIRGLERQALNRNRIAQRLNISPSTVFRWYVGDAEPSYHLGAGLLWLAGFDPPDVAKTPSAAKKDTGDSP